MDELNTKTALSISPTPANMLGRAGAPAIVFVLYLVLLLLRFSPFAESRDDFAPYTAARALLKGEKTEQLYPSVHRDTPALHLLLATAAAAMSSNPALARVAFGAFLALTIALLFAFFRKPFGSTIWILLIMLATSGLFVDLGLIVNGEVPATMFAYAALLLLRRYGSSEDDRYFWLTTLTSVVPIHFGVSGFAFSAAWILTNILERRYRHAFIHLGLIIFTTALFRSFTGAGSPFVVSLFQRIPGEFRYGFIPAGFLWARISEGLQLFFGFLFDNLLIPSHHQVLPLRFASFLIVLVAAGGLVRNFFLETRILTLHVLFIGAIIVLHPDVIAAERLFFSLLPGFMSGFVIGLLTIVEVFENRTETGAGIKQLLRKALPHSLPANAREALWIVAISVSLLNGIYLLRMSGSGTKQVGSEQSLHECMRWLRSTTPTSSVIMSDFPVLLSTGADRRVVRYPSVPNPDAMRQAIEISGATHLVVNEQRKRPTKQIYSMLFPQREWFRRVYFSPDSAWAVLEVVR